MDNRDKRINYLSYLKSKKWKYLRKQALIAAGWCCKSCNSKRNLAIHHLKYPDVLGKETPDMLKCLCEDCHNKIHNNNRPKKIKRLSRRDKKRAEYIRNGTTYFYSWKEIDSFLAGYIG